ncbi:lipocalin-like domain-containing protein [Dyella acidiphila]|uniref:Lipocalin-like domain-containing protein n=1 Tax=Dyella acidiphila TaxID=2775866 RepID=A0ABR9GAE7_9GAMM|nr:lipocalin-like domain-containing protein [Dyella acidiphila]MBE1161020.1 lipocalin-like domain-containing protein [Dyella acidiphila]
MSRLSALYAGFALLAAFVLSQAVVADSTPSLEGTWVLKSAYDLHQDGSKTFGFGPAPGGLLMVDHEGRYSLQIYRSNQPTYAVDAQGRRNEFKPAEIASTHYGEVSFDTSAHTVTFRIERAYNLRWDGAVQVRPYQLSGDELSYQVPPQPGSDTVAVSVWRRVQPMLHSGDP